VADQLRPEVPRLAGRPVDAAGEDVLAFMGFPRERRRATLHSTSPVEPLDGEIKRRAEVAGVFPDEAAVVRLGGAILLERSDQRAAQRARHMALETVSAMRDAPPVSLPAAASRRGGPARRGAPLLRHDEEHVPATPTACI
jgi:putative transposase